MDIQKLKKINNKTKIWLISILKILVKKGNYIKYLNILYKILYNILIEYKDINKFFIIIDKNICLPINFIKKRIAGKNIMIPYKINENKKINLSVRIIINSLKFRNEKKLSNRLLNELIDIYNNRGISIKKRIEICKDIKLNSPNLRFLK